MGAIEKNLGTDRIGIAIYKEVGIAPSCTPSFYEENHKDREYDAEPNGWGIGFLWLEHLYLAGVFGLA